MTSQSPSRAGAARRRRSGVGEPRPTSAPTSGPRSLVSDLLQLGGATAVGHLLGLMSGLITRVLLEPAGMGVWSAGKLLVSYGNYASLGATKGAAREVALQSGRGDAAAAQRACDTAFTFSTLSCLVYAGALWAYAAWLWAQGSGALTGLWCAVLGAAGVLVMLHRYATFAITVLRSRQSFDLTARVAAWEALVSLAATGVATWCWGFPGLLGGTVATALVMVAYLRRRGALEFRYRWDHRELVALLRVGMPILANGVLLSTLRSVNRWMILAYGPECEEQLGLYSLATMAAAQFHGLGNLVGVVMYPRYQAEFGRSGNGRAVAHMAGRVALGSLLGLGTLALLSALVGAPLLAALLPQYRAGLPAMLATLPGIVLLAAAQPMNHYLIAVNRHGLTPAITAACLGIGLLANGIALAQGGSITAVACATSATYAVYFAALAALWWRGLHDHAAPSP